MCVAVIELIVCRIADVNDRDIKIQGLSCERMICVDGDSLSLNLRDNHDLLSPAAVYAEFHPGLHFINTAELPFRDFEYLSVVPFAVGIFR